ncbi:MFS transporter [Curvibacter sp. CHRR-16]|uniref:MFS transporter n=1 Tax=Curvibacter sp. CHRR-16 TaxID=2835872 RepID=UPI002023A145|nr:MFS transporter [Curvibacter sp. CHRR-16]
MTHTPSPSLVTLLAAGAGLGASTLYLSQPLLNTIALDMHVASTDVGLLPTLTQLGYASGIFFLIPLGDRWDRRLLIGGKAIGLALALLATAVAPGIHALWLTALVTGLLATLAQDIVPAAAMLAADSERGHVVGRVMTGLFVGILLSRVFSGLLGQALGWRAAFGVASTLVLVVGVVCARGLPHIPVHSKLTYGALLASLWGLWLRYTDLRKAVLAQAALSVAFSAFWSTLAIYLGQHHHLGSAAAGAFGLAGAAGALAAPWAGKWADRRTPHYVVRWGVLISTGSFVALLLAAGLPTGGQLVVIAAVAVLFDFGTQIALVAHQTSIYKLETAARSRLNALLVTGMFLGMALGSALASQLYAVWGWVGVVALCIAATATALGLRWKD